MGGLSYFTTRHFLISQRQSGHPAPGLRERLADPQHAAHRTSSDIEPLLVSRDSGRPAPTRSSYYHGKSYASSLLVSQGDLPPALRRLVAGRVRPPRPSCSTARPSIAVGIPIPSVDATYFEVFDVSDLAEHAAGAGPGPVAAGPRSPPCSGTPSGRPPAGGRCARSPGCPRRRWPSPAGELDTRLRDSRGRPGPGRADHLVQPDGRPAPGAHRAGGPLHLRRQPRAALARSPPCRPAWACSRPTSDELSEPARRALVLLAADLRRFQRMVGDLLEISRSDTGSADVSLEEVHAGRAGGEGGGRQLAAHCRRGAAPPDVVDRPRVPTAWLAVDKRRFERVMANLLENAALYGGGATRCGSAGAGPTATATTRPGCRSRTTAPG